MRKKNQAEPETQSRMRQLALDLDLTVRQMAKRFGIPAGTYICCHCYGIMSAKTKRTIETFIARERAKLQHKTGKEKA